MSERSAYDRMMMRNLHPDSNLNFNSPVGCNTNQAYWAPRTNYDQHYQKMFCPDCCSCGSNPGHRVEGYMAQTYPQTKAGMLQCIAQKELPLAYMKAQWGLDGGSGTASDNIYGMLGDCARLTGQPFPSQTNPAQKCFTDGLLTQYSSSIADKDTCRSGILTNTTSAVNKCGPLI